ncbi:3'(2'),5'-bisphosphate nucleotidase CysQ [Paenirhodobacter populi]|uniref:3'(2'),5'-bisphosphate nucleotidase CysQ n=1 Tax=Paenirhodobacter populi TaxID=2306993 RepID=UPI001F4DDF80|nr:3'(2'),5'-bisphosphate nucleotidase CysQ [Sinirhodobacter populi]
MPANDYLEELALLSEAAEAAGEVALRYWKHAPSAWEKADGAGPVSVADLAVNDLLESRLRGARPDYGWLSEESVDDPARLSAKRIFIIDPIDGTRAFLNDEGSFSHALAVAENGHVIAAVVYLPVMNLNYTAVADGHSLLNGRPIHPSQTTQIDGSTVLTSRLSDDPRQWEGEIPDYRRSFRPSLAYRLCLVAEGRFDATISLRGAWEWDIAAASLIAERAGVLATDRKGKPLHFNTPSAQMNGLVVAPPVLHAEYIRRIRPLPLP